MSIRHVIWDFNGTLIDDVDCCVATLNTLLDERGLPALSRADYLGRFSFPVYDFYLGLGFDLAREDFDQLAAVYNARYHARIDQAAAHAGVHAALSELQSRAIAQSVVSASESTLLHALLARFGLRAFMTHVRGLDHQRAHSKLDIGLGLQRELDLAPDEILLVGDTLHDHELASALGCRCLLYARGHQTRERLMACGAPLVDSLAEVVEFVDLVRVTVRAANDTAP
jgi:phosphoglycolate phosphatase